MKRASSFLSVFIITIFFVSIVGVSTLQSMQRQKQWEEPGFLTSRWRASVEYVFENKTSAKKLKELEVKRTNSYTSAQYLDEFIKQLINCDKPSFLKFFYISEAPGEWIGCRLTRTNRLNNSVRAVKLIEAAGDEVVGGDVLPKLFDLCFGLIKRGRGGEGPIKRLVTKFFTNDAIFEKLFKIKAGDLFDLGVFLLRNGQSWWLSEKSPIIVNKKYLETILLKDEHKKKLLNFYVQLIKFDSKYKTTGYTVFEHFSQNKTDVYPSELVSLGIEFCMATCANYRRGGILIDTDIESVEKVIRVLLEAIDAKKIPVNCFLRLPRMYVNVLGHINNATPRRLQFLRNVQNYPLYILNFFLQELAVLLASNGDQLFKSKKDLTPELQADLLSMCYLQLTCGTVPDGMFDKARELVKVLSKDPNRDDVQSPALPMLGFYDEIVTKVGFENAAAQDKMLLLSDLLVKNNVGFKEACDVISIVSETGLNRAKKDLLALSDALMSNIEPDNDKAIKILEFFGKKTVLSSDLSKDKQLKLLHFCERFVETEQGQIALMRVLEAFLDTGLFVVQADAEIQKLVLGLCKSLVEKDKGKELAVKLINALTSYKKYYFLTRFSVGSLGDSVQMEMLNLIAALVAKGDARPVEKILLELSVNGALGGVRDNATGLREAIKEGAGVPVN